MTGNCDHDDRLARQEAIELDVARAKREILDDIFTGVVPPDVADFAELHDYVDANCYAGYCEDGIFAGLVEMYGGRDSEGDNGHGGGIPDGMVEHINAMQAAVDAWLKAGRP